MGKEGKAYGDRKPGDFIGFQSPLWVRKKPDSEDRWLGNLVSIPFVGKGAFDEGVNGINAARVVVSIPFVGKEGLHYGCCCGGYNYWFQSLLWVRKGSHMYMGATPSMKVSIPFVGKEEKIVEITG